ncbi:hypothetical protein KJ359_011815 [Pestalotiopsis sp. 9143b]|nr:hypothetical protein KJ359_011815 [Pestalotiopsis sp. 9143b]
MDQSKRGVEQKRSESPVDSESSISTSSSDPTLYDLGNYKEAQELGVKMTHKNLVPTYNAFGLSLDVEFHKFDRLPRELQNQIWLEALRTEARRTVVVYSGNTGGLLPSVKLISRVSKANKAAYTSAMEFFNFEIEVFACVRSLPDMIPERRRAMGILRLNLDHTTLLLEFPFPRTVRWVAGKAAEYYSGTRPKDDSESTAYWIARRRITAPLSPSQCALVKRIYEFSFRPDRGSPEEPRCCWDCEWLNHPGNALYVVGAWARYNRQPNNPFPNVWLARMFIVDDEDQTPAGVFMEYAGIDHDEWWAICYRTMLVTYLDPPVRRLGFDEFEADPNPNGSEHPPCFRPPTP